LFFNVMGGERNDDNPSENFVARRTNQRSFTFSQTHAPSNARRD
jgi:hypothetical protein